jgi:catechol 2,3-dioxygenase-like lactoylglutathione lyase family enzyme
MAVRSLHHVQVNVPLVAEERARQFYREIVGLVEMPRPQSLLDAGRNGVWYEAGDQEFHVFFNPTADFDAAASSQHPAFLVDDLKELQQRLEDAGYEIEAAIPIAGRARFFTRDPGGNRIEFLSLQTS